MLEARLEQANILKKVVDAIKDLVQDCNFDCNDSGIALQAMDNSHVALVSMMLKAEGFSPYRCDRNIALGVNLTSLTKVLRAAQNEDILTLKAEDAPDVLNLVFESSENDRISEYDLKLMDIDQEHLGIPQTEYAATIAMPASEFRRICTDLAAMSESVNIEASKDGVGEYVLAAEANGSGHAYILKHRRPYLDVSPFGVEAVVINDLRDETRPGIHFYKLYKGPVLDYVLPRRAIQRRRLLFRSRDASIRAKTTAGEVQTKRL